MPPKPDKDSNPLGPSGVDILQTSHIRTFLPGTGGPHIDVPQHNILILVKQVQDLRQVVETLKNRPKPTKSSAEKPTQVEVDEQEEKEIVEAICRFVAGGEKMLYTRAASPPTIVQKWIAR